MRACRRFVRKELIIATACTLFLFGVVFAVSGQSSKKHHWNFTSNAIIESLVSDYSTANKSILVCVTSATDSRARRDAIRETWGSHPSLKVTFFLGLDLTREADVIAEAQKYGDIVQYDFPDSHRSLTLKTASIVHWAHRNPWKHRTHVFKIDDDVFLNTRLWQSQLKFFEEIAIYGSLLEDGEPVRDSGSKWYLSYDEYYPSKFPTYLSGAFYVFHERAIQPIFESMCGPNYIPVEDVYFTGLVADRARVKRIDFPQTAVLLDVPGYNEDPLTAWFYGEPNLEFSSVLAVHYVTPALQKIYWNHLRSDSDPGAS